MWSGELSGSNVGLSTSSNVNNHVDFIVTACLIGIAWYNALELIVLCFTTFKRYGGCYFWCLLIASISIIPFAMGYLLLIYGIYESLFPVAMELVAWVGMVTGQSLVLWSRLHLVIHNQKILRALLAMIIVDAIILHIPAAVLELGVHSDRSHLFEKGFSVFERIQLLGFSLQEVVLSAIYSWEAARMLNLRPRSHYKGTLIQLLVVNLIMVCMDASIVGVQFAGRFDLQFTLKAMCYSIKLKLEYAVLGKLVAFTEMTGSSSAPTDLSDFVDLAYHHNQNPQRRDDNSRTGIMSFNPDDNIHHHMRFFPKDDADPPRSSISAGASSSPEDLT